MSKNMAGTSLCGGLWHYGLWSFQAGATRFLHKNQHWINGELSKIGHNLSNKVI